MRVVGAGLVVTPEVANINHLLILFLVTSHHGGRTVLCGSGHKRERALSDYQRGERGEKPVSPEQKGLFSCSLLLNDEWR